jgi:hypothetical protein
MMHGTMNVKPRTVLYIYETFTRPISRCGAEAWTVTSKKKMNARRVNGRKIVRKPYGSIREEETREQQ